MCNKFKFSKYLWSNYESVKQYSTNLNLLVEQSHALIFKGEKHIVKVCKAQRFPKDYLRKYFGTSQAFREYAGAMCLNSIGISTPKPIAKTYSLLPWARVESIYVMSYLDGFMNVGDIKDEIFLETILVLILRDLKIMKKEKILFKDLHLSNIMFHADEIVWIDTDIKYIEDEQAFNKQFSISLAKLVKKLPSRLQQFVLNTF